VIKRYVDIHATVFLESQSSAIVPSYVKNHGILSGPDLHHLLQQSMVGGHFFHFLSSVAVCQYFVVRTEKIFINEQSQFQPIKT